MTRYSFVLAAAAMLAAALHAQPAPGARALNPAYLGEFPAVERVLSEIHADDAQENSARQMGAFLQFIQIIQDMSGDRWSRGQSTPDELRVMQEYKTAQYTIEKTLKENFLRAVRGYDIDPKFRAELLSRFFSPVFQAQYARVRADMDARTRARYNAQVAAAGPPPSAASVPRPAAPVARAASPPPAPRALDASVAKARAAGVDAKVFGIPLGEVVSLPVCNLMAGSPAANCVVKSGLEDLTSALLGALGGGDAGADAITIALAKSSCPLWLTACTVTATLDRGALVAVSMTTDGPTVEAAVGKELRGKYGEKASMQQKFISPNNGEKKFEVWDLE